MPPDMMTPATEDEANAGSAEEPICRSVRMALEQYFHDLDGEAPQAIYAMVLARVEKPMLQLVLEKTQGNQSRAAELLGINRNTLRKKLQEHGLL